MRIPKIILSVLVVTALAKADIESNPEFRKLPGYSAAIPIPQCHIIFPYHLVIPKQIQLSQKVIDFNLYSFTAVPFDETKESILVIEGGPGGLRNYQSAQKLASKFSNFNLIFFHYRGGGCSSISDLDPAIDKFITPQYIIEDLESIRTAYKISNWKSVVGFSYGTDIARLYAKQKPEYLKNMILEGLSASFTLSGSKNSSEDPNTTAPNEAYTRAILSNINSRYQSSTELQKIDISIYKKFVSEIESYLKIISPFRNYYLMGYWDYEKEKNLATTNLIMKKIRHMKNL